MWQLLQLNEEFSFGSIASFFSHHHVTKYRLQSKRTAGQPWAKKMDRSSSTAIFRTGVQVRVPGDTVVKDRATKYLLVADESAAKTF